MSARSLNIRNREQEIKKVTSFRNELFFCYYFWIFKDRLYFISLLLFYFQIHYILHFYWL